MRSRLALLTALVIAAAAAVFAVSRFVWPADPAATSLPSDQASYLGVFESGPPGTYQPVADFTSATGTQPNLVGYYSGWREPFQTSFAETVREHGAATHPAVGSYRRLDLGDRRGRLRQIPAFVRRQRP